MISSLKQFALRYWHWLAVIIFVLALVGAVAWYKLFRAVPQPTFASEDAWFKYGSFDGEASTGLPYWIWVVMPRIFPELLPGPGGYKSFGLVWEDGQETPAGFAKKTLGFPRVTQNCALCHTATYRLGPDSPRFVVTGAPAHTFNIQQLLLFLTRAAEDPRFNADTLLAEITRETKLTFTDKLLYRFAIIPLTRKALQDQGRQLAWINRPGKPAWGPGRDDPFNLPKFMLAHVPEDSTHGPADFSPVWRLDRRKQPGHLFNWGGETPAARAVLVDSSLGFGVEPNQSFETKVARLDRFLSSLPAPAWPYPAGEHAPRPDLVEAGRVIYTQQCARCHEPAGEFCGKTIPLAEIGTDPERANTWSVAAADAVNQTIKNQGFDRPNLIKSDGYLATPLDGLWLRAPYLHNGSVPTLRDLLEPVAARPRIFYRGYDLFDPVAIGFVTSGEEAQRTGWKFDVSERGNNNHGHTYGTNLLPQEKSALLEYLKTL